MDVLQDIIVISLPFKAEYVSVARLTASGIASRIGFDIEIIEDIKVALAEVCNKLVNAGSSADSYRIEFKIEPGKMDISFGAADPSLKCIFDSGQDTLAISIMNALMDNVEFCPESGYLLTMSKSSKGNQKNV